MCVCVQKLFKHIMPAEKWCRVGNGYLLSVVAVVRDICLLPLKLMQEICMESARESCCGTGVVEFCTERIVITKNLSAASDFYA